MFTLSVLQTISFSFPSLFRTHAITRRENEAAIACINDELYSQTD